MKLLIISQSPYPKQSANPHWCYLGMDLQGKIYRPIPPQSVKPIVPNEREFFWPPQYNFQVGEIHEFEIAPSQGQSIISLPHVNDDIQVTYKRHVKEDGVLNMAGMFQRLSPHARETNEEALGFQGVMQSSLYTGTQYVEEYTNCNSFGILKVAPQLPQLPFMVIIELARPFSGFMNFNPRRCFLVEVGMVSSF